MYMTPPAKPLRVPITVAAERGVSWLNELASERRVVLTRFGKSASVVDSAERLDDTAARVDAAASAVLESFCDVAHERAAARSLEEVCERLGLDVAKVRKRSVQLAAQH